MTESRIVEPCPAVPISASGAGSDTYEGLVGDYYVAFASTQPGTTVVATYAASVPEGLAIMLGYFVVSTILGLIFFEMKDFN